MKIQMTKIKRFLCLGLAAISLSSTLLAQGIVTLPLEELMTIDPENVPERIRVTIMLDYYGRTVLDGEARILEKLPDDWQYTGKITMSGEYSRAGAKSVRWDWGGGDHIRIKDLGVLTPIKYRPQRRHQVERYLPIEFSVFFAEDLPPNTEFINLYCQRSDARGKIKLVKFRFYLTYGGTWVTLGHKGFDDGLGEVIEEMPSGLAEPDDNEIVLQVPANMGTGTYYLDRLLTVAELPTDKTVNNGVYLPYSYLKYSPGDAHGVIDGPALPVTTKDLAIGMGNYIPEEPVDPTTFTIHGSGEKGYFAKKPPIPENLTPEQQQYVDGLRASYFGEIAKPLEKGSTAYSNVEAQAKQALQDLCVRMPGGGYKIKESINFSGSRMWFKGDRFHHRKHHNHIPKPHWSQGIIAPLMLKQYSEWLMKCPDSPEVQKLFRAGVAWFKYQVTNPPGQILFRGKYGADNFTYVNKLIPFLRSQGEAFQLEMAYLSKLMMFAGNAYAAAWHKKETSANSLELGHALSTYHSMFYEADDRVFYAMLKNFRDNWKVYYGISIWSRNGMIKPDYTFFHHGELSYWGNITGYTRIGEVYANTPLDFTPETHKTLANHVSRYVFGALPLENNKGGQGHNWGKYMKLIPDPDKPVQTDVARITNAPKTYLFDYFYGLEWEKNPAAQKYLAGVLGKAATMSPEVLEPLYAKYPRLKPLEAQPDIHFSVNWTGAGTYTRGMSTAFVLGAHDITGYRGGTPLRRYGSLLLASRNNGRPLGVAQQGYSWVRVPGNTMPALTDGEWKDQLVSKNVATPPSSINLGVRPVPGNGSLTFNETDSEFGKYGNFALKVDETEKSSWQKYGVKDFQGQKSYHFYKDKIVCLGSGYQADTDRSMRTVLFQDMVDDIPWSHRDAQRWNPEKPRVVINGEAKHGPFKMSLSTDQPTYLISPYGHAWLLGGNRNSRLQVQWAKQETFHKYRFNKSGNLGPGEEMTEGTAVIASLEQDPRTPSSHHYCVLLNSDGKSPKELDAYAKETLAKPGYQIIRQDSHAHALTFKDAGNPDLYSYLVFEPNTQLSLPYISSTNRRVNLMFQENRQGQLVLSVCDPHVDLTKDHGYPNIPSTNKSEVSRYREIQITFTSKVQLLEATSGLPQANPPLEAKVIGERNQTLQFKTSNGVTDTFVLKVSPES